MPPHHQAPSSWTYRPGLSRRPGTAWDSHRSVRSAIVNRRDHLTPRGSQEIAVTLSCKTSCWCLMPGASARLGAWHTTRGRIVAPPALSLPGPSVIATYCARCWLRTFPAGKFEQGFLNGHGPAPVGLGPPFARGLHRLLTKPSSPAAHTSRRACSAPHPPSKLGGKLFLREGDYVLCYDLRKK